MSIKGIVSTERMKASYTEPIVEKGQIVVPGFYTESKFGWVMTDGSAVWKKDNKPLGWGDLPAKQEDAHRNGAILLVGGPRDGQLLQYTIDITKVA